MRTRSRWVAAAVVVVAALGFATWRVVWPSAPRYQDPSLPVAQRVRDLLARMPLEAKVAQLQCETRDPEQVIGPSGLGSLKDPAADQPPGAAAETANRAQSVALTRSRLPVPLLIHSEGVHGLMARGSTVFPHAIGLAAAWNPELVERVATAIAAEARSRGIRQLLAPVVNGGADPRWGRVQETYGEDPVLRSRLAVAFCRGLERNGVVATPKHLVANYGPGGRDSNAIDISERALRQVHLAPFRACLQEGGAGAVMAAYNSVNGRPAAANSWLLHDILRKEWGFTGIVVSDYNGLAGLVDVHHVAATLEDAAGQALLAGLDVELPGPTAYAEPLLAAVRAGRVPEAAVDAAVSHVLTVKLSHGLFENPFADPAQATRVARSPAHRGLALQAARESLVLLKNQDGLLPLRGSVRSIAVIGPAAERLPFGYYTAPGATGGSLTEAIRRLGPAATRVQHAEGCGVSVDGSALPVLASELLRPPGAGPGVHGLLGEYFDNQDFSGQPVFTRIDRQVHFDWAESPPGPGLPVDRFAVRWTGELLSPATGVYTLSLRADDGARLYLDDHLVNDSWQHDSRAREFVPLRLEEGRRYAIRVEYHDIISRAVVSLDSDLCPESSEVFRQAVALARRSDVALVVATVLDGEGMDRSSLSLPGAQPALIRAVAETGTPTVVVLASGGPVTTTGWLFRVGALLQAWYPGEAGAEAIAEALLGVYNPGGRLPVTFPRTVGQAPWGYGPEPSPRGRAYLDLHEPLFAFGHGLSYTRFEYQGLRVEPARVRAGESVDVFVRVRNAGSQPGDEVVQLYLHQLLASVERPSLELKDFARVSLAPGEVRSVRLRLQAADFSILGLDLKPVIQPGAFELGVGGSSDRIELRGEVEVLAR